MILGESLCYRKANAGFLLKKHLRSCPPVCPTVCPDFRIMPNHPARGVAYVLPPYLPLPSPQLGRVSCRASYAVENTYCF